MTNLLDSGFIKLQRKILDWEWYNDIPTKTLFIHLLLKVNFKDKKWKGYDIKRGQILTGRKILSDETGLSEQQTKTALRKLQATNEITIQATNRFSIITLVNYSLYQDKKTDSNQLNNQPEEQQATSNQPANDPTSNQQATTTKNDKNEKNDKKNTHGECVSLTINEFDKLIEKYKGIDNLNNAIQLLNNYKMSNGKKYKSDYHVLIGWVYKRFLEDKLKSSNNHKCGNTKNVDAINFETEW